MLRQIFFVLLYLWWIFTYAYLILFPIILTNSSMKNNIYINKLLLYIKSLNQIIHSLILKFGFNGDIYINEMQPDLQSTISELIISNTNKIDIMIANHIHFLDSTFILSILNNYYINSYAYVFKKDVTYLPGFGLIMSVKPNIKVNRNWEQDKNIITDQLDMINCIEDKQIIIIFPEGTRKTPNKFTEGQQFSRENNLPVYCNLLVPRIKGLQLIINHLQKTNKMGRLWDLSIISKVSGTFNFFNDMVGPIYTIIREIELANNVNNTIEFKNWFLKIWQDKDDIISNYKLYSYKKIDIKQISVINIILIIIFYILTFLILFNKYGKYYFLFSILISYIYILTQ